MKKLFSILTLALLVFVFTLNSCQQKPAGNGNETPVVTPTDSPIITLPADSSGNPSTGWMIGVVVKDANQRVVQGATVNLPCAGLTMTTDANGSATFNGEGNCPCNADNSATVSKKGMCSNIIVPLTNGCGYTYSATCQ